MVKSAKEGPFSGRLFTLGLIYVEILQLTRRDWLSAPKDGPAGGGFPAHRPEFGAAPFRRENWLSAGFLAAKIGSYRAESREPPRESQHLRRKDGPATARHAIVASTSHAGLTDAPRVDQLSPSKHTPHEASRDCAQHLAHNSLGGARVQENQPGHGVTLPLCGGHEGDLLVEQPGRPPPIVLCLPPFPAEQHYGQARLAH